jgi:hypothetical protein
MTAQSNLFDPITKRRLTLQERFDRWVDANPNLIELFLQYAREAQSVGRERYGIGALAERVRWNVVIEKRGEEFALNNDYRSRLARLLVKRDPNLAGLFEFRKLTSEEK